PFLVEDDRRRQALERVDVRPGEGRHEALHERAVGLVDQPLRLGRERAEDQRALARPGNAGEHGQPALRDVEADVAEVVLAGAPDLDGAPGVRWRCARRLTHVQVRSPSVLAPPSPGSPYTAQPAAFLIRSAIRFSTAGVSLMTANSVGHISPSSSFASGWKPTVE